MQRDIEFWRQRSALFGAKYLNRETQLAHDAADGLEGVMGEELHNPKKLLTVFTKP